MRNKELLKDMSGSHDEDTNPGQSVETQSKHTVQEKDQHTDEGDRPSSLASNPAFNID